MGQKEWMPTEVLKLYWLSFSTFVGVFKKKPTLFFCCMAKYKKFCVNQKTSILRTENQGCSLSAT